MVENVLLAQEVVKHYHKPQLSPRCALKIDLMKAFDSVSWDFIFQVLISLGFPTHFVNLLKICISTTMFSIVFNGNLCGYFSGKKGVRQGDPLSPYIFVVCMEVLSRMLNQAAVEGKFAYHPKCEKVRLTHLCFADDLIIFTNGSITSLDAIDEVLKQFYTISGLRVNYAKSELFCCGLHDVHIKHLTEKFGFKIGSLPVRYLGVPLITGKLSQKDVRPLIAKITDRMTSWATKHLSFAGRLQLITSVVQSTTNFWCSIFILPKAIIKEIEKICSAFLWNNTTQSACGAKVNWLTVCSPKQEGGLGLKSLVSWNQMCILKHIWLLFSKAGSIWVAWVHEYLIKGRSFWTLNISADASWGWRKILKLRHIAKGLIQHIPGDGTNIYIWHDYWHPSGPLIDAYGSNIVKDARIPFQAKLASVINGNFWQWPPARSPQLVQIQMHLFDMFPKEGKKDTAIWRPSNSGNFKVGQTWNWLRRKKTRKVWHRLIWFSQAIPKHSFISWLAILNRLSTKARQRKWTPTIVDTCVLCNSEPETSEHLFFNCSYTQKIWKTLSAMAGIPLTNSWQGLLHWMGKKVSRKSLQNTLVKLAWNAAVYHIWKERNRRIHQKHFKADGEIVYEVQFDVRCKILGFAQPKSSPLPMDIAKQWGLEDVVKE
ncbi:hypothetical protein SLA2020_457150 [Shorea laevis]